MYTTRTLIYSVLSSHLGANTYWICLLASSQELSTIGHYRQCKCILKVIHQCLFFVTVSVGDVIPVSPQLAHTISATIRTIGNSIQNQTDRANKWFTFRMKCQQNCFRLVCHPRNNDSVSRSYGTVAGDYQNCQPQNDLHTTENQENVKYFNNDNVLMA